MADESIPNLCQVSLLGRVPYEQAWDLQNCLAEQIALGTHPPSLLLLEHPHTYTFGRRGHIENLLWDEAELERHGVHVHWVDRGGDVTYHGPGQLVGYPLLPLKIDELLLHGNHIPQADYVGYIRKLEETIILTLMKFGVPSGQVEGLTGVWVQPDVVSRCTSCPPALRLRPAKIAAIGIKVDAKGVTRHGFALNINPDMHYWQGIVGCGLADFPVISLADLVSPIPPMPQVAKELIEAFGKVFGYTMTETPLKIENLPCN